MIFQYEDIYNFPQRTFDKIVEAVEEENETDIEQEELEKEVELEANEREIDPDVLEYIEADSNDDDFENNDDTELSMVGDKTIIL